MRRNRTELTTRVPATRHARSGLLGSTAALLAVFVAGAMPIPLYNVYRAQDGITTDQLAFAAVTYFAGAITTLLVFSRLSDHLGRKPITFLALAFAAAGCVLFLTLHDVSGLLLGRVLQGVAAGLASSATAAFLVDSSGRAPAWFAPTATGIGAPLGLAVGALTSGLLVDVGPAVRSTPYVVALCVIGAAAILVAFAPEPRPRTAGAIRSLIPRLSLPRAARRPFIGAGSVLVATWAMGGYYQSFGPSIARDELGSSSAFVAAMVVASYLAPTALGGPIAARLSPRGAQRLGIGIIVAGIIGLAASIAAHAVIPFILIGIVAGIAQGIAASGAMGGLLPKATSAERAGLLATIYAVSYLGAALPSFLAGALAPVLPLGVITLGYAGLALLAFAMTFVPAGGSGRASAR